MTDNLSLNFGENKKPSFKRKVLKDVIIDRKSKYTVVCIYVENKEEVTVYYKELLKDSYYRKATHNTYAFRIEQDNGSILESKNDDGETGAGNCILRELQRKNAVDTLIIVTRYFGGIQLHSDRFKNVIDATKIMLKQI